MKVDTLSHLFHPTFISKQYNELFVQLKSLTCEHSFLFLERLRLHYALNLNSLQSTLPPNLSAATTIYLT